jgi:16S rRNA (cytidine1402-2'-O)-methyltransferase
MEEKMEAALYLIPVTLGETPVEQVLPSYNHDIIIQIKYFIVENIRSACRFLSQVDRAIDTRTLTFFELNEHTDLKTIGSYLDPLKAGNAMGVISEAGCPAVADPGAAVVEMAQKKNLRVIPLVGPSSIIMAVMGSGFNGQSFAFNGYLPVKPTERAAKIRQLEMRALHENQTQLFIEAPYRNVQMLDTLLKACRPETKICIAAGITCKEEFIHTHTVAEWKELPAPDINKVPAIFLIYAEGGVEKHHQQGVPANNSKGHRF